MIVRQSQHGPGASFRDAAAYYLHDKRAAGKKSFSSERVVFTHCENLPTDDPHEGFKFMGWTAAREKALKAASGVSLGGERCRRPVYPLSLSWPPGERPTQEEMIAEARAAQAALGLEDHQAVYTAHGDTHYVHLHVTINRVHPVTGKVAALKFTKLCLSKWARDHERKRGRIVCPQREENWNRRERGEYVKYREPELPLKERITALYRQSDSGRAFAAALALEGYRLAVGWKIMLVDREGRQHSLLRNVAGVKAKDIRKRLAPLDLPAVETVRQALTVPKAARRPSPASSRQRTFGRAAKPVPPSLPFPLPPQRQVFPAPEEPGL